MRKNENKNEKGRGVVQLLIKRKSIKNDGKGKKD